MKIIKCLLSFFIASSFLTSYSQPRATATGLQKHDLSWITSAGDFDQAKLSKENIDTAIRNRIQNAVTANTLTVDINIPVNSKELVYLGYLHPNQTGLFTANPIASNNTPELNTTLHIYVW